MVAENNGGKFPDQWPLRPGHTIDGYDDLPREIRDILKHAPYSANIATVGGWVNHPAALRQLLARQTKEMALAVYGPDHPQAQ